MSETTFNVTLPDDMAQGCRTMAETIGIEPETLIARSVGVIQGIVDLANHLKDTKDSELHVCADDLLGMLMQLDFEVHEVVMEPDEQSTPGTIH